MKNINKLGLSILTCSVLLSLNLQAKDKLDPGLSQDHTFEKVAGDKGGIYLPGDWLYNTGAPAKSGVGGGIVAVIPGEFGIGVVSPPLDSYGNSVRAQLAIKYIIEKLGLNPLAQ